MKNYSYLSLKEREKVFEFLQEGCGNNEIAHRLNRDKGTILREFQRNEYSYLIKYLPDSAHQKIQVRKYVEVIKN